MLQYIYFLHGVILSFLIAATISDIKQREVPNWVSYGLVIIGLGLALIQTAVTHEIYFIFFSITGLLAATALAAAMFYTGQWGGGDSKLLIGLGAMLGLPISTIKPFINVQSELISFLINLVMLSLVYAIGYSVFLAIRNKKKFKEEFKKQLVAYSLLRKLVLITTLTGFVAVLLIDDARIRIAVVALLTAAFIGTYTSIFVKAIENSCMLKKISPLKLTEGDWIAKDVVVNGKRITGPKDLGIEQKQINKLIAFYKKKKIKSVLIKEGIPFAPSFLIAYIVTIFFGNLLVRILVG
jgi:Flp pilus assembly protein protease CpaA